MHDSGNTVGNSQFHNEVIWEAHSCTYCIYAICKTSCKHYCFQEVCYDIYEFVVMSSPENIIDLVIKKAFFLFQS